MNIFEGICEIIDIQDVADNTKQFTLKIKEFKKMGSLEPITEAFSFKAGQFISLGFEEKIWRAYSIASSPHKKEIELVIRLIPEGKGSEKLRVAKIGDQFPFKGPLGHFTLSDTPNAHLIFCATGTGIAPFRSMIQTETQKENPRKMTLFYGGRSISDIAYTDEIESWSPNIEYILGLSRDTHGAPTGHIQKGHITQCIQAIQNYDDKEFYICGNGKMVESVKEILETKNLSKDQIRSERFN